MSLIGAPARHLCLTIGGSAIEEVVEMGDYRIFINENNGIGRRFKCRHDLVG